MLVNITEKCLEGNMFSMRAFVGIELSQSVKEGIKIIQAIVKENAHRGRYKHIDNFHITLKFLGEVSKEDISKINEVLQNTVTKQNHFDLLIDKIGFFKGRKNIHALWLGMVRDSRHIIDLYKDIEEGLVRKSFKKDNKPYTPHITIAQDLVLKDDFENLEGKLDLDIIPSINIRSISLIKSEQIKGKRIYTPISIFRLKNL